MRDVNFNLHRLACPLTFSWHQHLLGSFQTPKRALHTHSRGQASHRAVPLTMWAPLTQVSQPQHSCHLGQDNCLLWELSYAL